MTREEELFDAARALRAPEERERFLHAQAAQDPALVQRVHKLLEAIDSADARFDEGPPLLREVHVEWLATHIS